MQNTHDYQSDYELDLFDLTCPGCGADLLDDANYVEWRICTGCNRHFWVSARERVQMFSRDAVFVELDYSEPVLPALETHHRLTPADRQDDLRERSALADALITGHLTLPHASAVVAVMDPVLLPTGLGVVTADKLIHAIRTAIDDRLPVVVICGGGSLPSGTGLLTAAQPLRVAGAIAELHRAGLALISILTHPTGGNVLSAIGINADVRLGESGTDVPSEVATDATIDRPSLLVGIEPILRAQFAPVPGFAQTLAHGGEGVRVSLSTLGAQSVVSVEIDSDRIDPIESLAAVRRAQRIASHLELALVLTVTGLKPISLQVQLEIRDLVLRHRRPTIGLLTGASVSSNLNVLAVDTIFGLEGATLQVSPGKSYSVQEAASAGIVDGVVTAIADRLIEQAIDISIRLSPARRIERRLRGLEQRGAETIGSNEASVLELMDLKEMQASFMRSVDDLRQKLENRDFAMPSFAAFQTKPHLPHMHLPRLQMTKPDLVEMRDKWVARRKAALTVISQDESE